MDAPAPESTVFPALRRRRGHGTDLRLDRERVAGCRRQVAGAVAGTHVEGVRTGGRRSDRHRSTTAERGRVRGGGRRVGVEAVPESRDVGDTVRAEAEARLGQSPLRDQVSLDLAEKHHSGHQRIVTTGGKASY